jgi:acetyltransferase-like isoleucine patch superfamily enzyme
VHIAAAAYLGCGGGVTLSDYCGVSHGARIYSANDDYTGVALTGPTIPDDFRKVHVAPVLLHRHVVVGAGTILLPGVVIGEGSTVGTLSLVSRSLEGWGVFAGIPARKLRDRSKEMLRFEGPLSQKELEERVSGGS